MKHLKLFESFEITEPIKYGNPLNNKEINFLKGYNVMCPEWILKDDNYYYIFDHRCENIKDVPLTYIHGVCKEYEIVNYTINDDYTIDVDGDIYMGNKGLSKIPLKFNIVIGYFDCSDNMLSTLISGPEYVRGYFDCSNNELTTLEGSPKSGGSFYCSSNLLTTLKGGPDYVGGDFECHHNQLTTLKGGPEYVCGIFSCSDNQLTTLKGSPKTIGYNFYCDANELTTLEGGPESVGGDFYCDDNPLTSVEYKGIIKGKLIYK